METVFILAVIAIVLVVVFYFLLRPGRQGDQQPTPGKPSSGETAPGETFDFEPDEQNVVPTTRRKVSLFVPHQLVKGARRKMTVIPQPLPDVREVRVPPEKGFDLLTLVFNPAVRVAETGEDWYDFDPPLEMTVHYSKADTEMTTFDDKGNPKLSIVTGYESDKGWRFERLQPDIVHDRETGTGTLRVLVKTLHPADPFWEGRP